MTVASHQIHNQAIPLLMLLLLAACQGEPAAGVAGQLEPVLTLAPTPTALTVTLDMPLPATVGAEGQRAAATRTLVGETAVAPTATPLLPPGAGLRPDQAQLFRQLEETYLLDTNPDSQPEWRPPPYPVPLSLHPDDHYWLIRPIPSSYRNYALEWYPYGSDVLLPELAPYRVHHGLDFPNDTGTPILAASSGTVIHAGELPSARDGVNYYGNTVIVKHDWQWQGKDVYTLYAHTLELFVQPGDYVEQGQLLAGVGASGEVSGAHLHLEVRVGDNSYHSSRNPSLWLVPYEGWGTLAGRFTDRRGRLVTSALVTVRPASGGPQRAVRTYAYDRVFGDEIWRENFVVGDLPTGRYIVELSSGDANYRRTVDVLPGRTNFIAVQAEFEFNPTPTPTATPPLTATVPITGTLPATTPSP